jgi:hypothetical protein
MDRGVEGKRRGDKNSRETDEEDAAEGPFVVAADFDFAEVDEGAEGEEQVGDHVAGWSGWLAVL